MSVRSHSAKEIWTHASITEYYPSLPLPLALTFAFLTKKEAPTKRKEKWKVPLPFEDRLFLDRVRTRSLARKLGVSFDLLLTEQLAVVETSQQLLAKRTYGHDREKVGLLMAVSEIYHVIQEPRFTFQCRNCGP